jgi:hypothetical protein
MVGGGFGFIATVVAGFSYVGFTEDALHWTALDAFLSMMGWFTLLAVFAGVFAYGNWVVGI